MFDPQNQPMFSRVYLKNRMKNALRYIGIEDYGLTKTYWVFNNIINLLKQNKFIIDNLGSFLALLYLLSENFIRIQQ